jgi:hypothetical protein
MLGQQQWVNAEIAARMMVNDYPGSATAQDCLQRVKSKNRESTNIHDDP